MEWRRPYLTLFSTLSNVFIRISFTKSWKLEPSLYQYSNYVQRQSKPVTAVRRTRTRTRMMQSSAYSTRPRPTIHFHEPRHNRGEFQFPKAFRKRKRGSPLSSDDEQPINENDHYPFHPGPDTQQQQQQRYQPQHQYQQYQDQDQSQPQPSRLPDSPIKSYSQSRSPSIDESESDHRPKRLRRTSHLERGMGEMSLQSHEQRIAEDPYSYLSTSPVLSSTTSTTSHSGTSYGEYRYPVDNEGRTDKSYLVSEPELLAIDEDFMPREDMHMDGFHLGPTIQEIQEQEQELQERQENQNMNEVLSTRANSEYAHSYPKRRKKGSSSWYEPEKDSKRDFHPSFLSLFLSFSTSLYSLKYPVPSHVSRDHHHQSRRLRIRRREGPNSP